MPSGALKVGASHRRSRSAGSMKSIMGEAPAVSPPQAQLRFSAVGGGGESLRASKKDAATSVMSPKLKKQQSTLGKFFTSSKSSGMTLMKSATENEQDGGALAELELQIALADGKRKAVSVKVMESWTVREVLDAFLNKLSSVKLRKFLASKNVPSTEALGLQCPSEQGPVWFRSGTCIGLYLDEEVPALLLADVLPLGGLSPTLTTMFVMMEDNEAKLMNMDESRPIASEIEQCLASFGVEDRRGGWYLFCCSTGKHSADGFWLDPQHSLAHYGLPLCSRLELREPNLVVLATIKGERLLVDGSSTGESFLRKHLQRLKV